MASELDLHRGVGACWSVSCLYALCFTVDMQVFTALETTAAATTAKIKMVSCFNSCARWPPNSVAGDLILTWHLCSDKQDQRGNLVKKPIIQQVLLKLLLSKWQSDGHVRSANTSLPNHTQRHTQRTRLTSTSLLVVCFGCH